MTQYRRITILRVILAVTTLLTSAALLQIGLRTYQSDDLLQSRRWVALLIAVALLLLIDLVLLTIACTCKCEGLLRILESSFRRLQRLGWGNIILFLTALIMYCFLTLGPTKRYLGSFYVRYLLFWLLILANSTFLAVAGMRRNWLEIMAAAIISGAAAYEIARYLPGISTHPFSLGWSEASRYYYASLYFSRQLYGINIPPTVLHPSRYLMQAVPFLVPNSPIWLHRLWQVLLWVVVTTISSWLLARRLAIGDPLRRWLFVGWGFLFLLTGPVYYHLQVTAILVLATFNRRRFWLSTVMVVLASAWAGISRINWFPVPGMIAAALYFLEEPSDGRPVWRYALKPVLWVGLGTLVAFGSQALYAAVSGNPTELFVSSFSSDLLWYRLFPSSTYPLGVLPAIFLVCAPLLAVIYLRLAGQRSAYRPIRLLGLAAMLLVLFAGGLVVSAKIGGGSNLHNMDAFLTLLLVVAAYFFFNRAVSDLPSPETAPRRAIHWAVITYLVLCPALIVVSSNSSANPPERDRVDRALTAIQSASRNALEKGGDVLLITERQLLTFGDLTGIPIVGDYEKVFLMEMAMAENQDYLAKFYDDLRNQRFSFILSEPLSTRYKGQEKSFGEENNAWVKNVSVPILCYYEPFRTFRELRIQLLKPRSQPEDCQLP